MQKRDLIKEYNNNNKTKTTMQLNKFSKLDFARVDFLWAVVKDQNS